MSFSELRPLNSIIVIISNYVVTISLFVIFRIRRSLQTKRKKRSQETPVSPLVMSKS